MNDYGKASAFSSLISTGAMFINPIVGIGAGLLGGLATSFFAEREQEREQAKLSALQRKQQLMLWDKIKRDNAELYSTVHSATSQKSGAMGAVY